MKLKAINGFKDILPDDVVLWQNIESVAQNIFHRFGFNEIRLPILEATELFARSIGQSTDIVEKEMYTFTDKGLTMRPEATASLLRAFIEHGMHVQQPVQRLYTIGPMFRHERPQKGRLRQFHQLNAEVIGAVEPEVDAEMMAMGQMILSELGLNTSLEINSLGCPECRPAFRDQLVSYLHQHTPSFCSDCQRRTETNPLRVLDCKKPDCQELVKDAPSILSSLCKECEDHFQQVKDILDLLGVQYVTNKLMVRGLDYYTRTTFEFITHDLGAQSAVGAGGRYDGLIEQLGGPKLPGIGFAMGMERIALLLQAKEDNTLKQQKQTDFFIAALGENAVRTGSALVHMLRKNGLKAAMDYSRRSLKAQMKLAGRQGAGFTLLLGDKELEEQEAVLRNMNTQEQEAFSLQGEIADWANHLETILASSLPVHERPESKGREI